VLNAIFGAMWIILSFIRASDLAKAPSSRSCSGRARRRRIASAGTFAFVNRSSSVESRTWRRVKPAGEKAEIHLVAAGRGAERITFVRFGGRIQGSSNVYPMPINLSAVLVHVDEDLSDQASPSSLVTGAAASAGIPVKILMERDQVTPMGIVIEHRAGAKHRTLAFCIAQKDAR
jgi:hypothetical protein